MNRYQTDWADAMRKGIAAYRAQSFEAASGSFLNAAKVAADGLIGRREVERQHSWSPIPLGHVAKLGLAISLGRRPSAADGYSYVDEARVLLEQLGADTSVYGIAMPLRRAIAQNPGALDVWPWPDMKLMDMLEERIPKLVPEREWGS